VLRGASLDPTGLSDDSLLDVETRPDPDVIGGEIAEPSHGMFPSPAARVSNQPRRASPGPVSGHRSWRLMSTPSCILPVRLLATLTLALLLSGCVASPPPEPPLPDDSITLYRDAWGIPYVFAGSEQGAQFGHGYAQAEDHLDQLLIDYLFADGRLSEAFADGDPELAAAGYDSLPPLEYDRLARQFRFREVADAGWDEIDTMDLPGWDVGTGALVEAFAAGIDRYMAEHPEHVPAWWQGEVDPRSVVAWGRAITLSYQIEWIASKLPGSAARSPDESPHGSNGWVLGPDRTASGNVMVQSDPHQPWDGPTIWYEVHLSGGQLEAGGATPYGVPFVAFAHNRRVVTTLTSNGMNNGDVFAVTVDPADPTRYLYGDESRAFTFEEQAVPQADGSTATLRIAWTHQGPVLLPSGMVDFSEETQVYVGAATLYEQTHALTELRSLGAATDLDSWFEGLRLLQLAKWNIMVGTADGHIAYVNNSRHPDRADSANYRTSPVDGSDPAIDWTTRPPWDFDDLAMFTDPDAGFLQNCNNSPGWSTPTFGDPIDEGAWPNHYMKQDATGPRSVLALRELDARSDWGYEDLRDVSVSEHVLMAEWWIPALEQAYAAWGTDPGIDDVDDLASAMALLSAWDLQASLDSGAMTLFNKWRGRVWDAIDLKHPPPDDIPQAEGIAGLNQLAAAWQDLDAEHGSSDVPWGDVHRIRRGELDLPLRGGNSALATLKVGNTGGSVGVGYASSGSSYMRLVELRPGQAPRITSSKPWGNSDRPESPHFDDLTELFAGNGYKELWFERSDVEAAAVSETSLEYP